MVAIRSEGVSETQQNLEGVENAMEDTADSAGDSAAELETFSKRFKGAMGAAVSALAIGTAGLLSQVPVVGEAMGGLGAIIDALTMKIDEDARPAVGSFTDDLYEVAEATYEADSSLEAFQTALDGVNTAIDDVAVSTLQTEIEELTGITIPKNWLDFGWDIMTLDARQTMDNIETIINEFPEDFGTMLKSIDPRAKKGWDILTKSADMFINDLTSRIDSGVNDVRGFFTGLASDLNEWGGNVASDAREWGTNLIDKFTGGIRSKISGLRNWLSELRNIGAEVGIDVPTIGGGGDGGGGGGNSSRQPFAGGFFGGGNATIDGRQISESTGRYRSDPSRRRGI
ncbi:phate tail tape measure protein [Haloferax tailed virus 1]|uniref:Phate tail tape measure protein n=1 Tax=Haloferax tailed virus 1 TaxID=2507575 RepID=A0A410N6W4_HFTV1|nr:phate tail tape measure protein [Haloferax tailed virus 1]QAS68873.1 phate tail tape measure protein [Haloferax tailed virus 1]